MDILLEGVGMRVFLALLLGLGAYALRHRGRLVKWIENLNASPNAVEKQERIKRLTRDREDIDAELANLQAETQEEK